MKYVLNEFFISFSRAASILFAMEWTFRELEAERATEVVLDGDFDLYNAPRFAGEILERIKAGAHNLRVDMSGVQYLDSTGVGAIIRILQHIKLNQGKVLFRGIGGSPRKVLQLSNVLSLIQEENTPKDPT